MDAIYYLYMELLALTLLVWLCRDKFKAPVARKAIRQDAPLQPQRSRQNRSSLTR